MRIQHLIDGRAASGRDYFETSLNHHRTRQMAARVTVQSSYRLA